MTIKAGLKIYSGNPENKINKIAEIADFIEVLIEPNRDFTFLKKYKTKFIVHCAHSNQGFNPADKMKWHESEKMLDDAVCAANLLKAKYIILHMGLIENERCSKENAINFFTIYQQKHGVDKRIIFENLSRISKKDLIMDLPDESKRLMKKFKHGLCLDFAHATAVAQQLSLDYKDVIKGFMKLKPKYFHVSDSKVNSPNDMHLHLGKGDLDLEFIKECIKHSKSKIAALEVPHDIKKNKQEVAFLKR